MTFSVLRYAKLTSIIISITIPNIGTSSKKAYKKACKKAYFCTYSSFMLKRGFRECYDSFLSFLLPNVVTVWGGNYEMNYFFDHLSFPKKIKYNLDILGRYSLIYPKCSLQILCHLVQYFDSENIKSRWVFFFGRPCNIFLI